MQRASIPPVVLIIAGNDPTGGAGLAADIQAMTALGVHPAPVVAALTVQDSRDVSRVEPVDPELVTQQAEAVLADLPVAAVKLGLLANAAVGRRVAAMLKAHPTLPLVVDPVLKAGGGGVLAEDALLDVYRREIFPLATLVTPNAAEARRLVPGAADMAARGKALLALGATHVLIKGADEATPEVRNLFMGVDGSLREFTWPRLPGSYHGSGCTLASAAAALLALGETPATAVSRAQDYTWKALQAGWQLGRGQRMPNRRIPK